MDGVRVAKCEKRTPRCEVVRLYARYQMKAFDCIGGRGRYDSRGAE